MSSEGEQQVSTNPESDGMGTGITEKFVTAEAALTSSLQVSQNDVQRLDTGISVSRDDIICNGCLYFDIEVVGPSVRILDVFLQNGIGTKAIVYSRMGSFVGHEASAEGWELLGPNGLVLEAGDIAGLLLATDEGIKLGWQIVSNVENQSDLASEGKHIRCKVGKAADGVLFAPTHLIDGRAFLGSISYQVEATRVICCSASAGTSALSISCVNLAGDALATFTEVDSKANIKWLRTVLADQLDLPAVCLRLVNVSSDQVLANNEPVTVLVPGVCNPVSTNQKLHASTRCLSGGMDSEYIDRIKGCFRRTDFNGDGLISQDELEDAFRQLGTWTDDEFSKLFAAADKNKDGKLAYEEFVDWVMYDEQVAAHVLDTDPKQLASMSSLREADDAPSLSAGMINVTCASMGGASATLMLNESDTIIETKKKAAVEIGIPAEAQILLNGADAMKNDASLKDSNVQDGSVLTVMRDTTVLIYGQSIGVFSNQNEGKGKDGAGTRLDLSSKCVKNETAGNVDAPMTRLVLKNCEDSEDRGAARMGHQIAILDQDHSKRVDLGYFCVTDCPASRDDNNTRLVFKRLDGPDEGAICYGHVVALFTESGDKRLNMSSMGDPNHESWATRMFLLTLCEGELVRTDVECRRTHE